VILSQLITRTGFLAIMNMLPLFLLAGRNNPLIRLTGITFDTYNLIHRWLGRIVVVEAIIHGVAWMVNKVAKGGWKAVAMSEKKSMFILSGTIGACAFTAILFQSPSVFRHAFYETFLHTHQALAALALGAVWVHLEEFPKQHQIIKGVLAIWVLDRSFRLLRILYRNVGNGNTRADVEVLPGDAVRVTMKMARPWRFEPGQHAYIYMPTIGLWMSHPFSVAWSDEEDTNHLIPEKLPMDSQDVLTVRKTTISFIIRRRTGFTEKLFKKADQSPSGRFSTIAFAEGPYGSQTLHSFGTVLLFAAGVGITHQVPHVRDLVTGYGNGTVAARKVVLIWIIQSPEHLEWIRPWMTDILGLPRRRAVLKILLFVTRPKSTKEIHSPSSSVQMFPGKPNIQALIDQEVEQSIGAVGVTVCGVGALADEVRRGCRNWMGKVNIEFVEESFSW
jgi:predicted ferric reductase